MELLTFPEAADALGIGASRVTQLLRDGQLVAVRDATGRRVIPARMIKDGAVVKALPAVITQLRDARFEDDEIVDWLHRADDSLRGSPLDALHADRSREVKRRAQVAGY